MNIQLEGAKAIAEIVARCRPAVVAAYPITPQTHIVEKLGELKAAGATYEFLRSESEFAAASMVLGASAAGARAYTATSSQGLLLMLEVVYTIAGMRLPVVMTLANRAVSAPINIWNDLQDAATMRDAGWISLFAETNQEAVDFHLLAFALAEKTALPVVVNVDGFVLTHTAEAVDLPSAAQVRKFLPPRRPAKGTYLTVARPVSLGVFVTPEYYQSVREDLQTDLLASGATLKKLFTEFKCVFGRGSGHLTEYYGPTKARTVFVAMGSVSGTIKETVDELNAAGAAVGLLRLKCWRPFPTEEVRRVLRRVEMALVIDKSISLGLGGPLATEIRAASTGATCRVVSAVAGLGGRDITRERLKNFFQKAGRSRGETIFL